MEEINLLRQNIASGNVQSTVGAEVLEQARGARKGDAATVLHKSSDLTDIQEEIGNSVGKLADKRSLGQAKVRQGAGVNREALKRIAEYYDKLPDAPKEAKLRDLVKKLQGFEDLMSQGGGGGGDKLTADDILAALRSADGNPRRQYMLLQGARLHFENEGANEELLQLLDKAEEAFGQSGIAQDVRADFAMLAHARKAGPTMGVPPEALRDKYREMLLSGMNLGKLFYSLSDFSKRLNFNSVVDLFLQAAGDDLAATSSETDQLFLGNLLKELGVLKLLRSAFEGCAELLEQTESMFPGFSNGADANGPNELMGGLLTFCSKQTPNLEDGRRIVNPFARDEALPEATVVFCNGLLDLHRDLPDQAFPSSQSRLQQVSVLTDVCSAFVELEEQAYEEASNS